MNSVVDELEDSQSFRERSVEKHFESK